MRTRRGDDDNRDDHAFRRGRGRDRYDDRSEDERIPRRRRLRQQDEAGLHPGVVIGIAMAVVGLLLFIVMMFLYLAA